MIKCGNSILSMVQGRLFSVEERELWGKIIEVLPENLCGDMLVFIEKIPDGLRIMTDGLKEKHKAIKEKDIHRWDELLQQDTEFIKSFSSNL